jgi:hypothetical protein
MQDVADRHAVAQGERRRPQPARGLVVFQHQLEDHRPVGAGAARDQPPGACAGDPVHRGLGVGRVGAEPGEDERDAAADRLAGRVGRPRREEEDGGGAVRLPPGEVRALQVQLGIGTRAADAHARESPRSGLHDDELGHGVA